MTAGSQQRTARKGNRESAAVALNSDELTGIFLLPDREEIQGEIPPQEKRTSKAKLALSPSSMMVLRTGRGRSHDNTRSRINITDGGCLPSRQVDSDHLPRPRIERVNSVVHIHDAAEG